LLVVLSILGFDFDTVGRRRANGDIVGRREADQS
jgi:signal peptidase II